MSKQNIVWFLLFGLMIVYIYFQSIPLILNIPFTSSTLDQYAYLEMGKSALQSGLFAERCPMYSLWLSILCQLVTDNLIDLFYFEKILSLTLLSLFIGILGTRVFDKWTGLILFAWTWHCKYLLLETNGSHTMACIFFVLAFLCTTSTRLYISQGYLVMLYFSALCRDEMWAVIILFVALKVLLKIREKNYLLQWKEIFNSKKSNAIVVLVLICFSAMLFFKFRVSYTESHRLSLAMMQTFTVNYIEQHQLENIYPDKWNAGITVLKDHFEGVKSPIDLITIYPQAFAEHVWYNFRFFHQIPAIVLGTTNYPMTIVLIIACLLNLYYKKEQEFLMNQTQKLLILSMLVLIPISLILKVSMRYYVQLIPVFMILILWLSKYLIQKIKLKFPLAKNI